MINTGNSMSTSRLQMTLFGGQSLCALLKRSVLLVVQKLFPRRPHCATNSFKSNDEQCYQDSRHLFLFNGALWLVRRSCEGASRFGCIGKLKRCWLVIVGAGFAGSLVYSNTWHTCTQCRSIRGS